MVLETLQPKTVQPDHREDAVIQAEAWMALWKADDLRSLDIDSIDLEVHAGKVQLVGHVIKAYHRQLAETLVKAVPGVNALHNELVVDSELAIEVAQALGADPRTRPYIILVGAFHGWVHLNGEVSTPEARSAVEEVAASVSQVRGVVSLPHLLGEKGFTRRESKKDNSQIQPQIGDRVYASDGMAGKVAQVIINPRNRLVTHVALAADFELRGQAVRGDFLVPAEAVNNASEGSLFLSDSLRTLALRPIYQEVDFPLASPEWRPPFPYRPGTVRWLIEKE